MSDLNEKHAKNFVKLLLTNIKSFLKNLITSFYFVALSNVLETLNNPSVLLCLLPQIKNAFAPQKMCMIWETFSKNITYSIDNFVVSLIH